MIFLFSDVGPISWNSPWIFLTLLDTLMRTIDCWQAPLIEHVQRDWSPTPFSGHIGTTRWRDFVWCASCHDVLYKNSCHWHISTKINLPSYLDWLSFWKWRLHLPVMMWAAGLGWESKIPARRRQFDRSLNEQTLRFVPAWVVIQALPLYR